MDTSSQQLLAKIPAGSPPPGIKSNFIDPPSLRTPVFAVNAILLFLATVVVSLRIYTKKFLSRHLWWDDYVCVFGLLGTATHSALHLYVVDRDQGGRHLWDIPAIKLTPEVAHVLLAGPLAYAPAIFAVKVSALLFLHQLFGVNKIMRRFIYGGIGFLSLLCLCNIGNYAAAQAICVSVTNLTTPYCAQQWIFTIIQGVLNTLTDIFVLVLPISMVLQLQLTRRRKIGVSVIFMTGLLATAASIARLILTAQRIHSPDLLWDAALTAMTSTIELNVGLICACMPAMPTFFKTHKLGLGNLGSLRSRLLGKSSRSSDQVGSSSEKKGSKQDKDKAFKGLGTMHLTRPTIFTKTQVWEELEEGSEVVEQNESALEDEAGERGRSSLSTISRYSRG